MFLFSSTYKSERVARFDPFMKISWGYGLDPLNHSPIPYQAPERWWWYDDYDDYDDDDDDDDDDESLEVWSNVRVGGNPFYTAISGYDMILSTYNSLFVSFWL